mmetsp:Transcript_6381/g.21417  ORF Transcript_6381/g.21417 Transcript_6381/m.21417 type:complete len:210 (-) Transcript_6381:1014-1643(-)
MRDSNTTAWHPSGAPVSKTHGTVAGLVLASSDSFSAETSSDAISRRVSESSAKCSPCCTKGSVDANFEALTTASEIVIEELVPPALGTPNPNPNCKALGAPASLALTIARRVTSAMPFRERGCVFVVTNCAVHVSPSTLVFHNPFHRGRTCLQKTLRDFSVTAAREKQIASSGMFLEVPEIKEASYPLRKRHTTTVPEVVSSLFFSILS